MTSQQRRVAVRQVLLTEILPQKLVEAIPVQQLFAAPQRIAEANALHIGKPQRLAEAKPVHVATPQQLAEVMQALVSPPAVASQLALRQEVVGSPMETRREVWVLETKLARD